MSEKIIKVGYVGAGRGTAVAENCIALENARLTAACDKNPDILAKARKKLEEKFGYYDCLYYDDYDEMLASDIDAVIVATEAVNHVPVVIKALEAGKHVLCEIPSVNSVEEAKQLKEALEKHPDLKYMAAENCCFWSFIESWKKMREAGRFGDIVYAEAEYLHGMNPEDFAPDNYPENHWRTYNAAIKYITHDLGPLLYIMDDYCVSVSCMEPDIEYNPFFPHKNATGVAIFKTAGGAVIRILCCFGGYASYDHNYRIIGTRGQIETDRLVNVDEAHSFANLSDIPGTFTKKAEIPITCRGEGDSKGGHGGAEPKMVKEFIDCIINDRQPVLGFNEAVRMSIPGIMAAESAKKGGEVTEIPQI